MHIGNEHFRRGEVPALRNGNHTLGINEVLEHGFFRFAWFIFSDVTELKLLSGLSLSYVRFQVLSMWSKGPLRFMVIYEGVQSVTKKTKFEPQVAFPTSLCFTSAVCISSFRTVH